MIKPTIGRVVWYHPPGREMAHAAIVTYVHSSICVNLACFNDNGEHYNRTSVFLWDGESDKIMGTEYAEWMPYQKAVAKGEIPPTLHATNPEKSEEAG